jgi:uracil-DNA glycosylase
LCFSETVEPGMNILKLPHPSKILANSQLKKHIWLDVCHFLKKIEAK